MAETNSNTPGSNAPSDPDCIFCKILAGSIPSIPLFEDDQVYAFMDAFPASEGHALVIPRGHYKDIHAIPESAMLAVARTVKRIAAAQRKALSPDGIVINQFNGAAAGQTVFHYHVHLIPRSQSDDRLTHGQAQADPDSLRELAEHIRKAL